MMYLAYKVNKQGDTIQPWHNPFPVWNQSVVPRPGLTVASVKPHTGFSAVRLGGLIFPSLEEFSTVGCDPPNQSLWHSQKSRCFPETLLLYLWSKGCQQFDLWFICLSKSSLNIWKFSVHVLLKPDLENFEHWMKIIESSAISSWQIDGETMETVTDFILGGLQNHCRWWLQPLN